MTSCGTTIFRIGCGLTWWHGDKIYRQQDTNHKWNVGLYPGISIDERCSLKKNGY